MNVHAIKTQVFDLYGKEIDKIEESRERIIIISANVFFPGIQYIKNMKFKRDLEIFIET